MDLGIRGQLAIITGGASGIGLATAHAFCQEGCPVVLWDQSPEVKKVADLLSGTYSLPVEHAMLDITNFDALKIASQTTLGSCAVKVRVVHCAAMGSSKFGFPFWNLTPDDWRKTLDVNMMGMVNLAHAVTPYLISRNQGSFVFLSSVAGQIGSPTDPPYSASKAANINFAQCMAKDLARHGIRVNSVCPGMVKTPLNRSVWQAWFNQTPENERLTYEAWTDQKIKAIVPLGQWQSPEDIAAMIVFLSSEKATQITGQTINVDGGFVMHW